MPNPNRKGSAGGRTPQKRPTVSISPTSIGSSVIHGVGSLELQSPSNSSISSLPFNPFPIGGNNNNGGVGGGLDPDTTLQFVDLTKMFPKFTDTKLLLQIYNQCNNNLQQTIQHVTGWYPTTSSVPQSPHQNTRLYTHSHHHHHSTGALLPTQSTPTPSHTRSTNHSRLNQYPSQEISFCSTSSSLGPYQFADTSGVQAPSPSGHHTPDSRPRGYSDASPSTSSRTQAHLLVTPISRPTSARSGSVSGVVRRHEEMNSSRETTPSTSSRTRSSSSSRNRCTRPPSAAQQLVANHSSLTPLMPSKCQIIDDGESSERKPKQAKLNQDHATAFSPPQQHRTGQMGTLQCPSPLIGMPPAALNSHPESVSSPVALAADFVQPSQPSHVRQIFSKSPVKPQSWKPSSFVFGSTAAEVHQTHAYPSAAPGAALSSAPSVHIRTDEIIVDPNFVLGEVRSRVNSNTSMKDANEDTTAYIVAPSDKVQSAMQYQDSSSVMYPSDTHIQRQHSINSCDTTLALSQDPPVSHPSGIFHQNGTDCNNHHSQAEHLQAEQVDQNEYDRHNQHHHNQAQFDSHHSYPPTNQSIDGNVQQLGAPLHGIEELSHEQVIAHQQALLQQICQDPLYHDLLLRHSQQDMNQVSLPLLDSPPVPPPAAAFTEEWLSVAHNGVTPTMPTYSNNNVYNQFLVNDHLTRSGRDVQQVFPRTANHAVSSIPPAASFPSSTMGYHMNGTPSRSSCRPMMHGVNMMQPPPPPSASAIFHTGDDEYSEEDEPEEDEVPDLESANQEPVNDAALVFYSADDGYWVEVIYVAEAGKWVQCVGGIRKICCHICGHPLADISGLKRHLLVHSGVALNCCPDCGRTAPQKSNLETDHMNSASCKNFRLNRTAIPCPAGDGCQFRFRRNQQKVMAMHALMFHTPGFNPADYVWQKPVDFVPSAPNLSKLKSPKSSSTTKKKSKRQVKDEPTDTVQPPPKPKSSKRKNKASASRSNSNTTAKSNASDRYSSPAVPSPVAPSHNIMVQRYVLNGSSPRTSTSYSSYSSSGSTFYEPASAAPNNTIPRTDSQQGQINLPSPTQRNTSVSSMRSAVGIPSGGKGPRRLDLSGQTVAAAGAAAHIPSPAPMPPENRVVAEARRIIKSEPAARPATTQKRQPIMLDPTIHHRPGTSVKPPQGASPALTRNRNLRGFLTASPPAVSPIASPSRHVTADCPPSSQTLVPESDEEMPEHDHATSIVSQSHIEQAIAQARIIHQHQASPPPSGSPTVTPPSGSLQARRAHRSPLSAAAHLAANSNPPNTLPPSLSASSSPSLQAISAPAMDATVVVDTNSFLL